MEIDILGNDFVHPTAKHNGFNYLSDGKFVKSIKEANQAKKEWKENNGFRERPYRFYRIHDNYDFLLKKTKNYLKSIIIYSEPHLKGSLYKCSKRDLIGIIKKEELLYFDF